jgi:hypothetical protein
MNSPFLMDQAEHVAKRFLAMPGTPKSRLRSLYATLLSRAPSSKEEQRDLAFVTEHARSSSKTKLSPEEAAWAALSHALMACNEFRWIDGRRSP